MSKYLPIDTIKSRDKLKLFNSFTKSKELFKPKDPNLIKWYNCGPTVYDISHMGHARCYISFDIIRRVLEDYFKYNIDFVQNITDIDDKIIKRARQNYLWNEFLNKFNDQQIQNNLINEFKIAKEDYQKKIEQEQDQSKKTMLIKQLNEANKLTRLDNLEEFKLKAKDVYLEYLDKEKGSTVTANEIFIELPRLFEQDYYEDMARLNVLKPTKSPRVSEYIDEIIKFIDKIIENGYAYRSDSGSVYFNTTAFNSNSKHKYGKLAPEAIGNQQLLNEGEGDLSINNNKNSTTQKPEKLDSKDFALWKASKQGEPSWSSKWSNGRPGWHIECSAMATNLLGDYADIHSGGIDLRFPHHENEIAQTESFYDTGKDWIKYFLHTGHLYIEGCKMSKSLKNFISIKDALKKNTARQIRLAFLLHNWEDSLDYSSKSLQEAISYENKFKEFFYSIEDLLTRSSTDEWANLEEKLDLEFIKCTELIDDYLCDNINTKGCIITLGNLINSVNVYLNEKKDLPSNISLLKQIAIYITNLLKVFGVIDKESNNEIGFSAILIDSKNQKSKKEIVQPYIEVICNFEEKVRELANKEEQAKSQELLKLCDDLRAQILPELAAKIDETDCKKQQTKKEIIQPYVDAICKFREKVREQAKEIKLKELFKLGDELRDRVLPKLAVKLDDKMIDGKLTTLVKIDEDDLEKDPEELERQFEANLKLIEEAIEKKRLEKEEQRRKEAELLEKKNTPPSQYFIKQTDKYSKFRDSGDFIGLPTHDMNGEEIKDPKIIKKLEKEYNAQKKLHETHLKKIKK